MNKSVTQMHSHKITIYTHDMKIFKLNVLTNDHNDQKQTILLLHGYLGSVSDYNPFFAKFAKANNIIAIDLRGHGSSDSPEGNWTIDDLVFDVYQVVRLLVPENKKILMVGNSTGLPARLIILAAKAALPGRSRVTRIVLPNKGFFINQFKFTSPAAAGPMTIMAGGSIFTCLHLSLSWLRGAFVIFCVGKVASAITTADVSLFMPFFMSWLVMNCRPPIPI